MRAALSSLEEHRLHNDWSGRYFLKSSFRLLDQCGAVGQKEHVGHMTAAAQHIGQAGCSAGLACARSMTSRLRRKPCVIWAQTARMAFF